MELNEYLSRKTDLRELIKKLDFTEEEVEDAAKEQPKMFLRATRYRVQKMRDKVEAELAYENKVAKLSSKYQRRKDDKGKRTLTEGAVKARVQLDKKVQILRRKMEMSYVHEKFSELLVEAYRSREKAIKVIIDARWAEAGSALKHMKEEGAKKMSRRLQKEVRDRYRHMRGSSDD